MHGRSKVTSSTSSATTTRRKKAKPGKQAKLSRMHKPAELSLEQWQRELRRQFGREQKFVLKNLGDNKVFSEFEVRNPQKKTAYHVNIRGSQPGENFCTCPDFATNTLGTCKHIEFALATLERNRGAAAALKAGYQPRYSEVFLHYGSRRDVRFRPGSDCPVDLARLAPQFFDAEGILLPEAHARFEEFLAQAREQEPELRCGDDVLGLVAEVRDAEERRRLVMEAFPQGTASSAFNDLLKVSLYGYQREGALFAARAGRCLLGDEMGLGKTVQAIAVAEIMARLFGVERVLVICPTSLKYQWQREVERLTERTTEVVGGPRERRAAGFATPSFFKFMNYDSVHADLDLIGQWAPDLVILDEAQRIKNWETRVARSVKRINSPYALVLTGTPLENRLEELISIVQFVDRYRLGPTFRLLHDHQTRDEAGKVVGYRDLDQIGRTLEPVLLRRQKDEVLDQLPERIDNHVFVPLLPLQQEHHTENREMVARIVAKWRRYHFLSEADKQRLMAALQRMRMVCDSTYLVDRSSNVGTKAEEAVTLLEEYFERPDTKAVVFSQWLGMHDLLVRQMHKRPWSHVLFHGGVPSHKRKDLVDRFRDDPKCRVFLSTDAGGVGLNLQHANVVFNMDIPWNPAVLEQRIGRVHRLGQKQPVRVVNFVTRGSIEEGMLSVLKFKKSLFAGVLDDGAKDVFMGGSRLTKFMEQVETATESVPAFVPEEADEPVDEGDGELPVRRSPSRREPKPTGASRVSGAPAISAAPAADPWTGLLQAGMALLQQASGTSRGEGSISAQGTAALVRRDEQTGEAYLRLPMPKPELLNQALQAFGALLEGMRG
jgi:superfamily II DNA or RNA helicase